jgi:HEAT repeat protein
MRRTAAQALGMIGDPQAIPPLIQALHDEDVWARREAAKALGKISISQAIPALQKTFQDRNARVRRATAEAPEKLPPVSPPPSKQKRRAWRKRLTSIRWAARQAKDYELLAAVLERQAAWETALSPWQDPLPPPPGPT